MLKWIYKRYKHRFYEFLVEDFYGDIPESVREPSIDFLVKARPALERFWSIQAYNIQRRSISDSKHAELYQGFLLCIRTLLVVVSKGKVGVVEGGVRSEVVKPPDPMREVEEFVRLAKEKK